MMEALRPYILSFIPLFVAVDAIGNIPIFHSLVEGSSKNQRNKIILDAVVTAMAVAIIFMFIGTWVFSLLGITIPDFQIAGGALLFVIAVRLLLPGAQKSALTSSRDKDMGVFPLGTPNYRPCGFDYYLNDDEQLWRFSYFSGPGVKYVFCLDYFG